MSLIVARKREVAALKSITSSKMFERLDKNLNLDGKCTKLLSRASLW